MMRNTASREHQPSAAAPGDSVGLEEDALRVRDILIAIGRKRPMRDPIGNLCEQHELTPAQLHTMLSLGVEGALTMGELARRSGVTEKTMTGVIDRLEVAGHLTRERDASDRRVIRARLTEQGTKLYTEFDARAQEKLKRVLGLLSSSDRKTLCSIFETLSDRVGALASDNGEESK